MSEVSVTQQIDQAKAELQDIGTKQPTQDENSYVDAEPHIDTPAHDSLATHLPTGEPETRVATPSTSLDDLRFRDVGLAASEDVKGVDPEKRKTTRWLEEDTDTRAKQQKLKDESQAILDRRNTNLEQILHDNRSNALRDIRGEYNNRAEEYDAIVVLLNESPLSQQGMYDAQRTAGDIDIALRAFRGGLTSSSRDNVQRMGMNWKRAVNPQTILEQMNQANNGLNTKDLQATAITALACGAPGTAIHILKGGGMVPDDQRVLFSEVEGIFQKAYDLYPLGAKHRFDQEVAALGADFLPDDPAFAEFARQASQRAKETGQDTRDRWYVNQEAVDSNLINSAIDEEHLTEVIDAIVTEGKSWEAVAAEIEKRAGEIADGKAANVISRELTRRLTSRSLNNSELGYNLVNRFYTADANPLRGIPEQSKHQVIERTKGYVEKSDVVDMIANPELIGMKQLIGFIKNPDTYAHTFNREFSPLLEVRDIPYPAYPERLTTMRKTLAETLVKGVTFLQTQAENPELRRVLQKEFGFDNTLNPNQDLSNPQVLEKAAEKLQSWFSDVADEESGATLYDLALEENQADEDTRIAEQIAASLPSEKQQLTEQGLQTAETTATKMTQEATTELTTEQERAQQVESLRTASEELAGKIAALDTQKEQTEKIVPVSGMGGRLANLLARKESITAEQKQATIAKIEADVVAAREDYATALARLGELGPVDSARIPKLTERLQRLEALRPAA